MVAAPESPSENTSSATEDRNCRTWRADPDRYIRQVKGGRYQARPHDTFTGERENLGTFATRHQARKAVLEFWAGKRAGKPKFVRSARNQFDGSEAPLRYFIVIPSADSEGKRKWQRVGGWYETEAAAAAAVAAILTAVFGRLAARALLSRRDSSARGKRLPAQ
jgi:hypothetical protein